MDWLHDNWFNVVQTIAIVLGLLFSSYTYILAIKSQRVTTTFQAVQYHRELWSKLFENPEIARILETQPGLESKPITEAERIFVRLIILHLSSVHRAIQHKAIEPVEGMAKDVQLFFILPIPAKVWREIRGMQNKDFLEFVEKSIAESRT